ncbi:MAG: PTPA-CTERM sorting domain-containing protein [Phormidesmis sp. CAN_BIN44]|nr:PTPA-CTERM sorting domain-containing protein [Phormidesmis sp. CAN_BIN44]
MTGGIIVWILVLLSVFFGGGGGGQNTTQNQPPKKQPQSEQKDSVKHPDKSGEPKNATSIPTPALLPGLIGLGAAALHKRKSALVKPED